MQLQFVARGLAASWPDLDALDDQDIARQAPRFRGGINNWIVQTYLHLRDPLCAAGLRPTIGETFLPGCINVAHRDSLNRLLVPYHRSYVVGIRADRPPLHLCRWEIVQNDLGPRRPRVRYVPFWPQPGLIERDRSRGARIETIVYFGRTGAIPRWFRDARFHAVLADLGVTFRICENAWFDYAHADIVLAHRTEAATLLKHKPASKLVNAWLAGTPALLADEPAYATLRRGPLDYISIASPADVIAAVRMLRDAPQRYEAMVANGRQRGRAYEAAVTRERWLRLLRDEVVPDAERWRRSRRIPGGGWAAQLITMSRQKVATKWFKWRVHAESHAGAA